jgi:hypothetical protein
MTEVMIVDADQLPETPKAFQAYVERYFRPNTMLGKRIFRACRKLYCDGPKGFGKGLAPQDSLDLRAFTEGLPNGQELSDWIRKHDGKCLWIFAGGYDNDDVAEDD